MKRLPILVAFAVALVGCGQPDEAANIPNAKPLDPAIAKKYAGWRFIPKDGGPRSSKVVRGGAAAKS